MVRFEAGAQVARSWNDEGIRWCACWNDGQDEANEFERDVWAITGRIGGESCVVTP